MKKLSFKEMESFPRSRDTQGLNTQHSNHSCLSVRTALPKLLTFFLTSTLKCTKDKRCLQLGLFPCSGTSHGTSVSQGTEFGKWCSGTIYRLNAARSYGKLFIDWQSLGFLSTPYLKKADSHKTWIQSDQAGRYNCSGNAAKGLSRWCSSEESTYNARDMVSSPGSGRSPGDGNGNLL